MKLRRGKKDCEKLRQLGEGSVMEDERGKMGETKGKSKTRLGGQFSRTSRSWRGVALRRVQFQLLVSIRDGQLDWGRCT